MATVSAGQHDPTDDEIRALVDDTAPRLFAVVVTYDVDPGVRDAQVAAWGFTTDDDEDGDSRTFLATPGGRTLGVLQSPESALRLMPLENSDEARIVWVSPLPELRGPRIPVNV